MALPINITDLLNKQKIESNRIEFKKGWNPASIYHSVCAFANDFDDLGGGYILVGVDSDEATGIPTIQSELKKNGSPRATIETNDERTFINVFIPVHSGCGDTVILNDPKNDPKDDLIGRVYEYFLGKFAIAEGKGKGEYYTPKTIVNLIAEMIEPYRGKIYDPCCGSGGMFVQSMKFIEAHHGNKRDISVYGQEYTNTTYKLAKMNLAIRGIACNLGEMAADTFHNDQHKDLKADFIMANPPFNQKAWRAENELKDDPRWAGYDVPPTSNANYGWILNIVSKLSANGTAGFLLANGALSGDGTELAIRKQLLQNLLVEAIVILPRNMFYSTDISVTLWILNNNKKARTVEQNGKMVRYRNREDEVLFIDLRQWGEPFEKKYIQFSAEQIQQIAENFHNWQRVGYEQTYHDEPEYCYSATLGEIEKKGWSLVPSKYIEFRNRDEHIDFDTKMKQLQADMRDLLQQEEESKQQLKDLFEKLGYSL